MEFEIYTLKNGIRIAYYPVGVWNISHCGFLIDAGTRDESPDEQGIAHFIEHLLFKGTKHRKAFHILSRLDSVGGELNAFTTKESTCIYASFLDEHLERAIELLSDVTFNSVFPEKEIEKEKDVVIDEINSYLDTPSEQIYDDFEEQIFAKHPLSNNILGTISSVKSLNKTKVLSFVKKHYVPENIVFSYAGNMPLKTVIEILEEHTFHFNGGRSKYKRKKFSTYKPSHVFSKKNIHQAHCMIGNIAFERSHKNRIPMILLNNLLGGPAMNSRLNLAIREKYGYTYNLESNYQSYSDTGLFSVYLGTDPAYLEKTKQLVLKELEKLKTQKLGTLQLNNAKKQLKGQIALAQENGSGLMLSIGKTLLYNNKIETLKQIFNKIDLISSEKLLDISNQVFENNQMSSLTFKPSE
jgi:predicted Zn-dependent peptidase